ncbi:MAG: alpha-mannosidase [Mucilaginibacter sp.]|nr:alpha-mannosidase [Mucilaginibacter sp.]
MLFRNFMKTLLRVLSVSAILIGFAGRSNAQTAWYIDGYHGGIYGGYPPKYTRFIVEMLRKHPNWKINLEIEPETWDSVQKNDSSAYQEFKGLVADQSSGGRIEFINPDYGQSYLYNISGESIIRQFSYGIKKLHSHFPGAVFSTYSSEEPCFTSALPQILISFGFKYASLKNPNTCFGGYTSAHGGELVNWIGPDGTAITTAPRYAMEALSTKSTWQTIGWENSPAFINKAYAAGINHPIGMTIQDAGWKGGPFMKDSLEFGIKTIYTTWRNYFENVAAGDARPDWKPNQEDMLVNLVWGSQVTQKIAQEVRMSENKIIATEKLAALAKIYNGTGWPGTALDAAWRTLLLSQHHDCWIVPYNGRPGETWADKVLGWTDFTNQKCDSIISVATNRGVINPDSKLFGIRVYNTLGLQRKGLVFTDIPGSFNHLAVKVTDGYGNEVISQIVTDSSSGGRKVAFNATVPSMGYNTYRLEQANSFKKGPAIASVRKLPTGDYLVETDLYTIDIDPSKGGIIKSLRAKRLNNREFVDRKNKRGFNELRGNFYNDGGFKSSEDKPAKIDILEDGPLLVKIAIRGTIDNYPFTQLLSVAAGQKRIDLQVKIEWKDSPGIGKPTAPGTYKWQNPEKAFYDDRYKLLVLFPLNLKSQKVYKDAPFDVTESHLENTFYNRWDSIKNNVVLNWVDVMDNASKYGVAMYVDHTTSYTQGTDFPLGLDVQYSGMGLWGRDYKINGTTTINYALIPHEGKWDASGIWTAGTEWAEPLVAKLSGNIPAPGTGAKSFLKIFSPGLEVTSMSYEGDDMLVRVFNAEGNDKPKRLTFDGRFAWASLVELNGKERQELKLAEQPQGASSVDLFIPRFGIRTIKLQQWKSGK